MRTSSCRPAKLVLLLLMATLVGGCTGRNTYWDRRGRDLADILRLNVTTMGPGIVVNARATQWLRFGGGLTGQKHPDWPNLGQWHAGTMGREAGVWRSHSLEYGFGPFYHEDFQIDPHVGNVHPRGSNAEDPYDSQRSMDEFGATVHLGIIGLDVGVRPLEVFDFLLGVFNLDLMYDDYSHEDPSHLPQELQDEEFPTVEATPSPPAEE